jgi:hypothetical protein
MVTTKIRQKIPLFIVVVGSEIGDGKKMYPE